ncbi:hypothetical protein [Paenibacillus gallinarum]|uniref:IDEAL domain-containing protein n=1 Tax=Paenibacillus gallinarum TaxID=2762232 RepID=A0ABR8T449_9BACL|nr:hypothetical protein [Paenibacillus gallinarum]MBD7970365.1 hypothetical protein [Paenibacillus gallinarum]
MKMKYAISKGGEVTERGQIFKVTKHTSETAFLNDELVNGPHLEIQEKVENLVKIDEEIYMRLRDLYTEDDYDSDKVKSILRHFLK